MKDGESANEKQAARVEQRWSVRLVGAVLVAPLAVTCAWLSDGRWGALLDLALFEVRVRDVGTRYATMLGLGGRLAQWPEIGRHPGPLAFYFFAPVYRLLGSSFWALRVAAAVSTAAAILVALTIARRRAGVSGVLAIGLTFAILQLGFGLLMLTEHWNAYIPVPWFVTFVLAIWAVVDGDVLFLPVACAIGSLCAQTHISFAPVCAGLSLFAFLLVVVRLAHTDERTVRRRLALAIASSIVVVSVAWTPPLFEQLMDRRGNLTILYGYLHGAPESRVGLAGGFRLLLEHLDLWSFIAESLGAPGTFRQSLGRTEVGGGALFAVWLLAFGAALKSRNRSLITLGVTIAAGLTLCVAGASRIVGFVFPHVVFFLWCMAGLVASFVLLTAMQVVRSRIRITPRIRRSLSFAAVSSIAAFSVRLMTTVRQAGSRQRSSSLEVAELGRIAAPKLLARQASGTSRYLLGWDDALYGGSIAFGVFVELERRGVRIFLPDNSVNRAFVGKRRVLDPKEPAEVVQVVNGGWIEDTRKMPHAVELAYSDTRTAQEREMHRQAAATLTSALERIGRSDLVARIERTVTAVRVQGLTGAEADNTVLLDQAGLPAAVFLLPHVDGPPGTAGQSEAPKSP